jgi:ribosomal protein L16 Arg81 hydroxylase
MQIQSLFGDVPLATFIAQHLHRLPFAIAASAKSVCELGTWESFGLMLGPPEGDVFGVRQGEWYNGPALTGLTAVRALVDEGYTVFMRHAERHHPKLAELAAAFEATFLGPVNIHVFVTPAKAPGFSWHYDAEDVFIIQTQGAKEYSLRKNTVNPWPLEETLPADMQYERELMPLMRVLLRAGDLLYIPCGYWHKAEARDLGPGAGVSGCTSPEPLVPSPHEAAISLAIGVMSRSAMDVYDYLRKRLLHSLVWRQRLPVPDAAQTSREEIQAAYRHLFQQLADDFGNTLRDPKLADEFLSWFTNSESANVTGDAEQ